MQQPHSANSAGDAPTARPAPPVWSSTAGSLNLEVRLSCEGVDKIAVVYPHNGILLCAEKELSWGSSLHIRCPPPHHGLVCLNLAPSYVALFRL